MPTMRRVIVGADTNAATHHYHHDNCHVQHHGKKEEQIVAERAGSSNIVEASTPKQVRIDQPRHHATNNFKSAGAEKNDLTLNCYAQQRRPVEGSAPAITVNMMISTAPPIAPPLRAYTTSERESLPGTSSEHQYYHVEPQLHFLTGNNDRLLYRNALPQQNHYYQGRESMYTDCYDDTTTADILNTGRVHPTTMTNVSTVPMISEMARNSYINNRHLVREQTLITGVAPQVLTLPSNLAPQQIPATNVDGSPFFGQGTNDIIFAQKLPSCVYPVAGQQEENEISFSNYPINNTGKRDNMPATAYHHDLVVGRPPYSFDRRQSHQVAEDSSAAEGASKKDEPGERPITYYQSRHPLNAYNYFFSEEREIILTELKFALQKAGTKAADLSGEQIQNILDSPPILPPEIQKDLDHRIKTKARETLEMRNSGQSRRKPPHRKSHGLVGFHSLSKAIGKRWKNLPKSSKRMAYFKQLAKEDSDLYKKIKKASRVKGR